MHTNVFLRVLPSARWLSCFLLIWKHRIKRARSKKSHNEQHPGPWQIITIQRANGRWMIMQELITNRARTQTASILEMGFFVAIVRQSQQKMIISQNIGRPPGENCLSTKRYANATWHFDCGAQSDSAGLLSVDTVTLWACCSQLKWALH